MPFADAVALSLILLGAPGHADTTAHRIERVTIIMGTSLSMEVEAARRSVGFAATERALAAVRHVDDLLSTWRDDSELARLNRAPVGRPVTLSAELAALLDEAAQWQQATGGAFDPAVGALIDAWDLRGAGRRPAAPVLTAARQATGLSRFILADGARVVRRTSAGSWIDSGAFGKGAALRAARAALGDAGITAGLLDFGGQVLALGAPADSGAWSVSVAHPARRDEPVLTLRLRDRSASTSSQSERFVAVDGERFGHLLDPRTGRPLPAWGSVTVVADDPAVADILSTALFVLGPDAGLRWAEARGDVAALFLVDRGDRLDVRSTRAMQPYLMHDHPTSSSGDVD